MLRAKFPLPVAETTILALVPQVVTPPPYWLYEFTGAISSLYDGLQGGGGGGVGASPQPEQLPCE